jgi:hypothetical protein
MTSTQFHAGRGAFMIAMTGPPPAGARGASVWIGAKTREALLFLRDYADAGWDHIAF